jgi:hypothetical protein
VQAVEEAIHEAAKHDTRCEALAALVEHTRTMIEQARAAEAERGRVAAEAEAESAAAAAEEEVAEAAERLRMEEHAAALTLTMQTAALQLQQLHAQLGVVAPAAPAPQPEAEAEGSLCVVCMDAPKQYAIRPCMHMCTCEACTQQLVEQVVQSCPVCREPIERVFA